eukprot:Blabericola_migrator_1__5437@NODE_277_length_10480_cov_216_143090_g225_i1_p7_GENE_NODE_277_length_10480_cov_216_143090_g225_i1NODE_277_length_10480_cov_216_143090_g225_i1_p7_ORF_typecomplete_len115_score7_46PROL5SMR/PF15621_6/0_11_NODE_277_length_10480_cov_216_143090_g225_i162686612
MRHTVFALCLLRHCFSCNHCFSKPALLRRLPDADQQLDPSDEIVTSTTTRPTFHHGWINITNEDNMIVADRQTPFPLETTVHFRAHYAELNCTQGTWMIRCYMERRPISGHLTA